MVNAPQPTFIGSLQSWKRWRRQQQQQLLLSLVAEDWTTVVCAALEACSQAASLLWIVITGSARRCFTGMDGSTHLRFIKPLERARLHDDVIADGPFQYLWKWRSVSQSNKQQPTVCPEKLLNYAPQTPPSISKKRRQTLGYGWGAPNEFLRPMKRASRAAVNATSSSEVWERNKRNKCTICMMAQKKVTVIVQVQNLNTGQAFQEMHASTKWGQK